jgi:hypothetical protein
MSRLWRYLFNRSNLFVAFLIILTGVNIILVTRLSNFAESQNKLIVRVEDITKDNFNLTKIILSDQNGYWLVEDYKGSKLNLGYEILVDIKYSKFKNDNKYSTYFLSKGLKGTADIINIYSFKSCDLNCKYINLINNSKRYIGDIFLQSSCNSERWLSKFFANSISCLDIANLSKGLLIGDVII